MLCGKLKQTLESGSLPCLQVQMRKGDVMMWGDTQHPVIWKECVYMTIINHLCLLLRRSYV